jgi:hypothetical protein
MDALFKLEKAENLNDKLKSRIATRFAKIVVPAATEVERVSGVKYPPYFVDPVLPVIVGAQDNIGGLGVMYARTLPILNNEGRLIIVVQLSAPFVLYATKTVVKVVLAHEFLHYINLVGRFSTLDINSQLSSAYVFEERYADMERLVDASIVFGKNKRLVRQLGKQMSSGLENEKLNEKCRKMWIEKKLPMIRVALGSNQIFLPVNTILQADFDPKARELAEKIRRIN